MCGEHTHHCCGENKLCSITCCPCGLDIESLKPLVNNPKYICKTCGHVANNSDNLCQPVALN